MDRGELSFSRLTPSSVGFGGCGHGCGFVRAFCYHHNHAFMAVQMSVEDEKLARSTKNRLLNLTKSQAFIMCVYMYYFTFAPEYFKVVAQYLGS